MLWGVKIWIWGLLAGSILWLAWLNAPAAVAAADAHPGLAAWVQSFGSIIALGVAVWVPWRIHQREQAIASMPRRRKLLMLKDALGSVRHALDHFYMLEGEFTEEGITGGQFNLPVVSDQVRKGFDIYLLFEERLPRAVQIAANELFEATHDIERLQEVMAAHRSMIFSEAKGLGRYNNHARVLVIALQKVGNAMREIDPLLKRAIERLK